VSSGVEVARAVRKGCGLPRVSLSRPDLKRDPDDPPGFRCAVWRFGESLGAERVGTTLYEIPPGQAVCPYPWVSTYPDSNKIGVWTRPGGDGRLYRLGTEVDYYDGESNQR
jgi:hypothetical protein